jgi:hypothetical protein
MIKRLLLSIVAKAMDETMIIDIAAENPLETLKSEIIIEKLAKNSLSLNPPSNKMFPPKRLGKQKY